jgi:xylulokinase
VRHVVASDGGAVSRVWMQIAADVLGHPIELLEDHPGSCLGAAYVAGVAAGCFNGWDEIARYVSPAGTVTPNPANADRYDRHYALYRELYERLQPFYPRLAAT